MRCDVNPSLRLLDGGGGGGEGLGFFFLKKIDLLKRELKVKPEKHFSN